MADDWEVIQIEPPSNACCTALKKKNAKLLEKCSKLEEIKNKFRDCTSMMQNKYDALEKENRNLKQAMEELQIQTNVWRDEIKQLKELLNEQQFEAIITKLALL